MIPEWIINKESHGLGLAIEKIAATHVACLVE
jgi:hypothetical protein